MSGETTSSTLSELYTEIVAEAEFVINEQSIMKNLVKNYTVAGGGKSVEVPIYPAVSAASVNEGTDLSNTAVDPGSKTITCSEFGIMTTLTDLARNSAPRNVAADIGRLFGEAIAKKMDEEIIAKFDGFSTSIGDATTAISAANIFKAAATLRGEGLPLNECYCVLHPSVAYDLKANLTNTFANSNGNDLVNEALREGFIGRIAGVPIFESANIPLMTSSNAGDSKGAMFHKDAIGLATMAGLKIETQRDASLRAEEIVATAVFGTVELHDKYGVELFADSSIL